MAGEKSIWRKIALRGNQTLDDLHDAIYDAFDRYDEHLYSFYFPPPGTKELAMSKLRDDVEYTHSSVSRRKGRFPIWTCGMPRKTKLSSLKLKPKQLLYYLFDFGDEWWHESRSKRSTPREEKGKYPRVVETHGDLRRSIPIATTMKRMKRKTTNRKFGSAARPEMA